MVVAAIIAEYNPFHKGHKYHIEQTRLAGATHIVAIMSGNFTQRGTPAIAEKHVRAKAALECGADLVVELPVVYSTATAQKYAEGGVQIAKALGCVDTLSFGSECGYLTFINTVADALDSEEVNLKIQEYLKSGIGYAFARQKAVIDIIGEEIGSILNNPNDTLAVEYVRALRNSNISPYAVVRMGSGHDSNLVQNEFASASYLRELISQDLSMEYEKFIPEKALKRFQAGMRNNLAPFDNNKYSDILLASLRRMSRNDFSKLPDVSEGINNRIYEAVRSSVSMEDVYLLSKTKRYTDARIRRIILSAYLGIDNAFLSIPVPYVRVLGFNSKGIEILGQVKNRASLPVSDSLATLQTLNSVEAQQFAEIESRSTDLYSLCLPSILPCGYDYTCPVVKML